MAIFFAEGSNGLSRPASLNSELAWTTCFWVKRQTGTIAGFPTLYAIGDGAVGDYSGLWVWLGAYSDSGFECILDLEAETTFGTVGFTPPPDQLASGWVHVAAVWDPGAFKLQTILNGVRVQNVSANLTGVVAANEWINIDTELDNALSVAYVRTWQAALTASEIAAEKVSPFAVRTSNLLSDTPLSSALDLSDISGTDNDWTLVGAAETVAGPLPSPIGLPIPPDTIVITDDECLGPAVFLDSTTGAVIGYTFEFACGSESGIAMLDGTIATPDDVTGSNDGVVKIYDSDLTLINRIVLGTPPNIVVGFATDRVAYFYSIVKDISNNLSLHKYDKTGAVLQSWDLASVSSLDPTACAVTRDNTLFFFLDLGTGIKQLDLGTDAITTVSAIGAVDSPSWFGIDTDDHLYMNRRVGGVPVIEKYDLSFTLLGSVNAGPATYDLDSAHFSSDDAHLFAWTQKASGLGDPIELKAGATFWTPGPGPLVTPLEAAYTQTQTGTLVRCEVYLTPYPPGTTADVVLDILQNGSSIVNGTPPSIAAGTTLIDSTLAGWTTALTAGDTITIRVTSTGYAKQIAVSLVANSTVTGGHPSGYSAFRKIRLSDLAVISDVEGVPTETDSHFITPGQEISNSCPIIVTGTPSTPTVPAQCVIWPVWLSDDGVNGETFLVFSGNYLGNGKPLRYDFDGNLVKDFPYDPTRFATGGMMGMAAILDTETCFIKEQNEDGRGMVWLAGHCSPIGPGVIQPGVLPIRLNTGEVLEPVVALPAEAEADITAGFTALDFPSGNGDTTDNGLPPKPTVTCGPLTNLRTPQPNAGCNNGGIGSEPTYTGPSGVVPVADDPVETTLTGKRDILIWTEIQHTEYADDQYDVPDVLRYGHVEIPNELRVEGRMAQAGSCEQASSDGQGNMKSASGQLTIFDFPDRPLATRRSDRTRMNFNRDELAVYAISDVDRRNGLTPKMLTRGLCYGDSNGTPGTATLEWVDHLHVEGGSFSPDKTMPMVRFPLGYYTNAPLDLANYFVPIIYGEKTDHNAKDPTTGLLSERGECTPRLVDPASTLYGDIYGLFVNNLFASYRIDAVFGSDCGGLGCWGMTAVSDGKKPNSTITLTGRGDFTTIPTGGWAELVLWTEKFGRSEHRILSVNVATNSVKVEGELAAADVNGPVDWMIERIDHAPRRVKLTTADRQGFDMMVPNYAGYVRPTNYEDFTDPTDNRKWRVTNFGIRGPLLREHLGGGPTIATNTIGIEDQGDGTGLPIVDAFTAFCHWMDNCLHEQRTTPPIGDNLWPQTQADLPQWANGFTKTRESSFRACQALTALTLGGYGLRLGVVFDQGFSLRDACQLWNDNLGCRTVNDEHGRMKVWMVDKYADTSTWPRIDHVSRVFGSVTAPRLVDEAMNVIRCGYDWDPDAQEFRVDGAFVKSDQAIRRNKGYEKPSKHYDFKMLTEKRFAEWRMNALLGSNQDGPIRVTLDQCDIGVFDYPVGTGVIVTSIMGPGVEGYVDHAMYIEDRLTNLDQKTVTLTLLDVGTDNKVHPPGSSRRFIATNNDSIAPLASNDPAKAPVAVS